MTEMRNAHIPRCCSWHVQLTTSVGGAALGRYSHKVAYYTINLSRKQSYDKPQTRPEKKNALRLTHNALHTQA